MSALYQIRIERLRVKRITSPVSHISTDAGKVNCCKDMDTLTNISSLPPRPYFDVLPSWIDGSAVY